MPTIKIVVTKTEREYVEHAAKLVGRSLDAYIRRAINASLCREGVDAVLLREKE